MLFDVVYIRAIACLTVVLLHSIAGVYHLDEYSELITIGKYVRTPFIFATPIFIVLSEYLLAFKYGNALPAGFLRKRVENIFVPFLVMGTLALFLDSEGQPELTFNSGFLRIFSGGWHGWFVLVIMQFYLFRPVLVRLYHSFKPLHILSAALVVQILFMVSVHALRSFSEPGDRSWFVLSGHRIFLPAWVFYFYAGHFFGQNRDVMLQKFGKNISYAAFAVLASLGLSYFVSWKFKTPLSSRRFDVVFYSTSVFALLIVLSQRFGKPNRFFSEVAAHSFGIFLWHYFFIIGISAILQLVGLPHPILVAIILFIGSLSGSVLMVKLLNALPFGHFISGRVNRVSS